MAIVNLDEKRRYLDFERPLADLDKQIAQLKMLPMQGQVDVSNEIKALENKSAELLESIFEKLTPYQIVQLSRHPDRPTCLDYIEMMMTDFFELAGDRNFAEDKSIVGGVAKLNGNVVMVIGHQKGKSTQDNMLRNFGMPKPEGYRKALRLMKLAERWNLPLITLVDTPGAYPGIEAEERGQASAIAENILTMTHLRIPIITVILGEGGSGGALAIAVADKVLMMQYSTYSVISPEGCASIIWKESTFASRAAEALKITAQEIVQTQVADRIVPEPLGGAHRDGMSAALRLKQAVIEELHQLVSMPIDDVIEARYQKYRKIGPVEQ